MKTNRIHLVLASAALFLSACAGVPQNTSLLDEVNLAYVQAQGNPKIATYAALEMQLATDALAKANAAAKGQESVGTVDQLAYLAKQKIALATEVASQKSSDADVASAASARDQVRLDQRTMQANQARVRALEAEGSAQSARSAALLATQEKEQAQNRASTAQRMTDEANARSSLLQAQLAELSAKQTERGLVITLGDVLFGVDVSRLNPNGVRMAQQLATVLQQNPARVVMVEGFADSTGTTQHNQALSERRAGAVRTELLALGVASERISMRGYGESNPVASNDSEANRQLNRRVEIVLSDERGTIIAR